MCDICSEGGQILGPYLKAMTHLMHTEYILAGRTTKDVRDVLRSSMYAATVTGSPVENACRLIRRYESAGRGYYGAVMALLGRDVSGAATADAPILLRTADVSVSGDLRVTAGATLVRDSDPEYEVAETHAKAAGILTAFGLVPAPVAPSGAVAELALDEDVLISLHRRNERLSRFWFTDQSETAPVDALAGKHVVVLDGEDDFVNMLQHVLRVLGMTSETVHHSEYAPGAFDAADVVVVGPGPGDPRDAEDAKIKSVRAAVDELLEARSRSSPSASATRCCAVCWGSPSCTRTSSSRARRRRVAVTGPRRECRLLQHVRRPCRRRHASAAGRQRRQRPADRRRPPPERAALPRCAVPRRVDPDRARRRPRPRAHGRAAQRLGRRRSGRSLSRSPA